MSGFRYPGTNNPQCRHGSLRWNGPAASSPSGSPAATTRPADTDASTGSYVVRTTPCRTLTTPRPATDPANTTTPAPAARTGCPTRAARSTPRCPGDHAVFGASNPRSTAGRGSSGHTHRRGCAAARTAPGAADGPAIDNAAASNNRTGTIGRRPRFDTFMHSG